MKFKLRFNLGQGENFMKWKLTSPDGEVQFFEPSEVVITLNNAKLINHKSTAKKIFDGANKEVCAWIEADRVDVHEQKSGDMLMMPTSKPKVSYNPRIVPNWVLNGENVDKEVFGRLYTIGRNIHLYYK